MACLRRGWGWLGRGWRGWVGNWNWGAGRWVGGLVGGGGWGGGWVGGRYVGIAGDRGFFAAVRAREGEFRERKLTAAIGCSSLPGLSGALAKRIADGTAARARVTLFIGNDNPKGGAAIRSVVGQIG